MEKKNPGVQLWLVKLSAAFSPQGWRGTGPISTESLKQESLSILWFYFLHPTTPNHRRLCICSCFPFQKNANIGPKPRQQLDQRLQKMLMTTVFYLYRFHGALTSSVFSHTTEGEVHHDWGKKWKCSLLFLTSRLMRPEAHVVTKPTGGGDDEGCRTEIKILLRDYEPSHPGKCEKFQSEREWNLHLTLSWFDTLRRLIASLSERFWAVSNSFNHLSRAERTVSPISLPSPPPLSLPLF